MALREPLRSTQINGFSASHRRRSLPRPVLDINFLAPGLGTPGSIQNLTFSRPSNATMFDSQGRMVWAPANMVGDSVDLTNVSYWNGSTANVSSRPVLNPFGREEEVFRVRAVAGGAFSYTGFLRSFSFPFVAGARYVFSCFMRADTASVVGLRIGQSVTASDRYCHYNLNTGVATAITPVEGTVNGVSMTNVGGGWWRCVLDWTAGIPTASSVLDVLVCSAPDGNSQGPYAGTETVFVYGPMVEQWSAGAPRAYIRSAGSAFHAPRFDTNPLTLQPRGLLMESFASNIIVHNSEVLRPSAGWSELNVATAPSALPDLFQNGVFITLTSTNAPTGCRLSSDNLRASVGAGWTNGQVLTATAYMRRGTANGYICFDDGGGAVYACCRVNLTGAGTVAVTGSGAGLIGTVERINNDTYRVRITYTYDGAPVTIRVSVGVWNSTNYIVNYPECTTNGQTVHAWGVQLETTGFPTSYIPRLGASTSRSRDFCATTNTLFAGTGTVGTWAAEGESPGPAQTNYYPCIVDFRNTNNTWRTSGIRIEASNALGAEVSNANPAGQYPLSAMGIVRFSVAADGVTAFSVSVNGTTVADPGAFRFNTMPTGMNQLTVGNTSSGLDALSWNGWVRRVRWWNSRLTDATLTQLTAP